MKPVSTTHPKIYRMRLTKDSFPRIAEGHKKIEFRLFDEKQQQLKLNDIIIFTYIEQPEKEITVEIIGLYQSRRFEQLFQVLDGTMINCINTDTI